jgi:LPS-assembly protein
LKKNSAFLFFFFFSGPVDGREGHPQSGNDQKKGQKDPLVLSYKTGLFDQLGSTFIAKGDVIARQKNVSIYAHQMIYDVHKKSVVAQGNVKAFYKTGDSLFCDYVQTDTSLKEGLMISVRSFMQDGARFTAKSVRKKDQKIYIDHGAYTPCRLCKDHLHPLWSIHAEGVDYCENSGEVHYHKPQMKMWGRTLFPLPSFRSLTKRASGILPMITSYSQELGYYAALPVYWAIRHDQDITLTPYLMNTGGAMLSGAYRYRFSSGLFDLESAINIPLSSGMYDRWKADKVMSPGQRGFMHNQWNWDINDDWRFRSDVWWSGDKTFLSTRPFFGNAKAAFLTSDTMLEGFLDHSFIRLRTLFYQDLIGAFKQSHVPCAFPEITYQYASPLLSKKHRLFVEGRVLNLYRQTGQSVTRLACDGDWSFFDTMPWGQSLHMSVVYRGALYRLLHRAVLPDQEKSDTISFHPYRFFSSIGGSNSHHVDKKYLGHQNGILFLESRWPSLNNWGSWTPVVQVIMTPKALKDDHVINEDSQVILFDDRNFLEKTRYLGYDRLDRCPRVNYGYEWSKHISDHHMGFFVGQSYAFSKPNEDLLPVGVRKGFSDVVTKAQWSRGDHELSYRLRSNAQSLKPYFQDITWSFGSRALSFLGTYEFFKEKKKFHSSRMIHHYQQLYFTASSHWGFWNGKVFLTHNLGRDAALLDRGFSVGYKNECLDAGLIIQKSFYKQEDMVPGLTISFHFRFKNLGGFKHRAQRFSQEV